MTEPQATIRLAIDLPDHEGIYAIQLYAYTYSRRAIREAVEIAAAQLLADIRRDLEVPL